MHGTQTSAVVAALVGLSMAAPAEVAGKKAFSVEQVAAGPRKALHPAQSMLNTYAKYGKLDAAPAEVKAAAAAAAQSGTVPANPEDNDVVRFACIDRDSDCANYRSPTSAPSPLAARS